VSTGDDVQSAYKICHNFVLISENHHGSHLFKNVSEISETYHFINLPKKSSAAREFLKSSILNGRIYVVPLGGHALSV
jgi:hypothetical protein